jgi:hypothetical protein
VDIEDLNERSKAKLLVLIAVAVVVVGIVVYLMTGKGELVEKINNAPTEIMSGVPEKIIFNASFVNGNTSTPVVGAVYSFRINPDAGKVFILPDSGITDESGNIELEVGSVSGFEGRRVLWSISKAHEVEKPIMHFKIVKPE